MDLKQTISRNKEITLLIGLYTILQLAVIYLVWDHPLTWDAAVYAGMGQYIYSWGEIGSWEVIRPVLIPFIVGLLYLANLPMYGYPRLLMLTISIAGLAIMYYCIKEDFSKDTALYSTGITSSSYLYLFHSATIRAEITAAILILASLYLLKRERQYLSGITVSLAFLARFPTAIAGLAHVIHDTQPRIKRKEYREIIKQNAKLATGFAILTSIFFLISHIKYGNFLDSIIRGIQVPAGNPEVQLYGFYYLREMIITQALLVLVPIGVFLAIRKNKYNVSPYLIALIVLYAAHEYFPHKEPRYSLVFLPLAAIYSSKVLVSLQNHLIEYKDNLDLKHVRAVILIVIGVILVFNFQSSYVDNSWSDPAEREFLDEIAELEAEYLLGNHPNIGVYGQTKYGNLPVHYLDSTYNRLIDEVDYIAINQCAWYNGFQETKETIESFEEMLDENHPKHFEVEGENCEYVIYENQNSEN